MATKKSFRLICRSLHRDLSYFFAGVILVYACSGFFLNHKKDFNAEYDISRKSYQMEGTFPMAKEALTKGAVLKMLEPLGEGANYTKHYFPTDTEMKVFIKGGSSLVLDIQSGQAQYESIRKRYVISALNRLHYNPNRNWTVFSDIFVISLIIITITGLIMMKGPKGLKGRGGIEFAIGILIPLLFILL